MVLHLHHYCRHFLIFCVLCVLLGGVLAAPATRSNFLGKDYPSARHTTGDTQVWRMRSAVETSVRAGRIDVELTDYPDPGANPGHEPPSPTPP